MLKIGDKIFYQKNGEFYVDRVNDIIFINEYPVYEPADNDFWCVTEDELLDESDSRVREYMCLERDEFVKLSDVRNWLNSYARNYYESDSWSCFNSEQMIKDLCKDMLYKN